MVASFFFQDRLLSANPLCRATLSLRPAFRRSCPACLRAVRATLPIGGRLFSAKEGPAFAARHFLRLSKTILSFTAIILIALAESSCSKKEVPVIKTWLSYGRKEPSVKEISIEENLPQGAFPLAGTVSHHLLTGRYIDSYFKVLSDARKVENFFIISPSHYGLSTQDWSLFDCSWDAGEYGLVHTDAKTERELSQKLGVEYDQNAFRIEHGLSTLMPYIAKYFPKARVSAIALEGEPPLKQTQAQKLSEALSPYFTEENSKKNFLLISTDFSHHGNREETEQKDSSSKKFFASPSAQRWLFCVCDNRQGMYVMANIFCKDRGNSGGQKKCSVLYHTDSFKLSGRDEDDITSYFFTFMY